MCYLTLGIYTYPLYLSPNTFHSTLNPLYINIIIHLSFNSTHPNKALIYAHHNYSMLFVKNMTYMSPLTLRATIPILFHNSFIQPTLRIPVPMLFHNSFVQPSLDAPC